jgi:hypothetical protein
LIDFGRYPEVADCLRKQLRGSSFMIKASYVFVGAIFPLAEALLVNAVSGTDRPAPSAVIALVVVGAIHVLLFLALLLVETPLPQLLVELDKQAEDLRRARVEEDIYRSDNAALASAVTATQYSLIELEDMRSDPELDSEKAFERVLFPWVEERTAVFGFVEGDALHNFAVYLESESKPDLLEVAYRTHDDRLKPTNRSWEKGDGHVGTCFLRRQIIFFSDEETGGATEYAETTQHREEDKDYYRSMMATPIVTAEGVTRGVFIVTSSTPGQFVRELHEPIIDVVGRLLAQALEPIEAGYGASGGNGDGQDDS